VASEAQGTERISLAMEVFSDERPWAITPKAVRSLVRIAEHADLEAVAARMGQPMDGPDVENHNGVAVVDIRGPLFRYRSIWTWLLGGTAVEDTAVGLHAALDDPTIRSIVLAINSPGGQIDGINELANMIRAANAQKPVTAYVDGLAASGAYWLASAAGRIVADETAQLGSIGVLATVVDDSRADEKRGVKRYDVVSSQSPLKRTDPGTDEGRAQLQSMVDALAQVFIEKVAKFRGTTEERVARDFGRGAVVPAREAVASGMADSLGSLESLLSGAGGLTPGMVRDVRDQPGLRVRAQAQAEDPFDEDELEEETEGQELTNGVDCTCPPGTEECQCGAGDDEDESEGTEQEPDSSSIPRGDADLQQPTEERQRIAAILTSEEARGREELARVLALETNHTPAAAKKLLLAAPISTSKPANALEARMGQIPNPQVGIAPEPAAEETSATEIQRILAFVPKDRKRLHVQ
jgi:capsid assembly protease